MRSRDTLATAEQVQIDLLRRAGVARRASLARSLSGTMLGLSRSGIKERNQTADADELALQFVAICYGPALADGLRRLLKARTHQRQT